MLDYAAVHKDFQWEVPKTFNFGTDVVDKWAEEPNRVALIWCNSDNMEERYTFADIAQLTSQFANLMTTHGVEKGDRVVIILPRIPAWHIAMVGCLRAGLVPIPCVTMLTSSDIAYRIENSNAKAVVTTAENTGKVSGKNNVNLRLSVGATPGWFDFFPTIRDQRWIFNAPRVSAEDPAILYYTSGSSGRPKGVLHASRAIFAWRVSA